MERHRAPGAAHRRRQRRPAQHLGSGVQAVARLDLPRQEYAEPRARKEGGADQTREWLQLGAAYRETETNRWNGLAKYEYKYEDDSGSLPVKRAAHILSTHASYQPDRVLVYTGRYAGKFVQEASGGLDSRSVTHLLAARVTRDLGQRWDIGAIASTLFSGDFGSRRYGLGAEAGYLLKKNLWVSAGYNFFGFKDDDLAGEDYTARGAYLRLRFKFDESLFGK